MISKLCIGQTQSRLLTALIVLLVMTGCATTRSVQQITTLESVAESPRVIMMPPDIRYYLLTAGGVPEPNVEWTEAARENFSVAAGTFSDSIGADMRILDVTNLGAAEAEYDQLHSAVGLTILEHHFSASKLPTKRSADTFDWSLGPEIHALAEKHDADYALFVYYRDYQASGGRVAFSILAAAAGAYIPAGSEHGFASLVDLNTGDIVWFNVVGQGSGEMRNESGATAAVNSLFREFPTAQDTGNEE